MAEQKLMADYLKRRRGREGFFFQRSVPPDCRAVIGKATWIRKVGNSATEAKRNAAMFLAETEQLIKGARGQQLTATQRLLSLISEREQSTRDEELHQVAKAVLAGTAQDLKTSETYLPGQPC